MNGRLPHQLRTTLSSASAVCGPRIPKPSITARRHASNATLKANDGTTAFPSRPQIKKPESRGLSRLPLSSILRSLLLGAFFISPVLFKPGFAVLRKIAQSQSVFFNPDRNPLLRALVKPFIYDHFCAGINKTEIQHTISKFKGIGYSGIILCYGKEFAPSGSSSSEQVEGLDEELEHWKRGNLETLDMLKDGDILGMKLTGAGKAVTDALINGKEPPKQYFETMTAILEKALAQNNRVFIDAEQQVFQPTMDRWTMDIMRKYNRNGRVMVYHTIQAYLKESRQKLERQLALSQSEGWTLAIKLVRGAYMGYDPRELIHDTKAETDKNYDDIVRDLMTGDVAGIPKSEFPRVELFLAGHNPESVSKASELVRELSQKSALKTVPEFGQLQGMADQLGCNILQRGEDMTAELSSAPQPVVAPRVYKWSTWGSVQECMQYLVRRAVENSSATGRMKDGMAELSQELKRRMFLRS